MENDIFCGLWAVSESDCASSVSNVGRNNLRQRAFREPAILKT